MRLKLYTYVVTLILIVGVKTVVYAEDKNPPPPNARSVGPPPPVGAQVPIDDYIPYLLILGIFIGGYFFYKAERQKVTNS
ncbi:MAG: hypothetical protein CMF34_10910 [Leeuwenhoekiella sp.]|uniref:hypothetical protein n=1 Tax=Leeuwenhoekiella palythoae TaxID=573501 RepID=UPI000C4C259D|nr:hypothetical protein [Leeuwenhoekiella palythoae]MAS20755.1 hypothetical protein [Leeuwenhoekiella sp.]UBZ11910.1 hypothetical protein LDL79_07280 [Leeuwenhoekiella palythoae]HBO28850.1 hypothetical protein [Leeuwenhoekiella sp.]|tara:strand:+ start:229 stop:468 length:240 start_codon:yes stop_codon:yes gene_type:complete